MVAVFPSFVALTVRVPSLLFVILALIVGSVGVESVTVTTAGVSVVAVTVLGFAASVGFFSVNVTVPVILVVPTLFAVIVPLGATVAQDSLDDTHLYSVGSYPSGETTTICPTSVYSFVPFKSREIAVSLNERLPVWALLLPPSPDALPPVAYAPAEHSAETMHTRSSTEIAFFIVFILSSSLIEVICISVLFTHQYYITHFAYWQLNHYKKAAKYFPLSCGRRQLCRRCAFRFI